MTVCIVSGSKLFEWLNKFCPFVHEMKLIEIQDNKFIYEIKATLFSSIFHTLIRDKVDTKIELNQYIPIGDYFKCYNDQYSYALKLTNANMI